MEIGEAKSFANQTVDLTWTDRKGQEVTDVVHVFDVEFLPLYGPCLVTSEGEIRLDRVCSCAAHARVAA